MRVYLDACCISRLTDDFSQARILDEAEAVEKILAQVWSGRIELISSEALEDEMRRIPSLDQRAMVELILSLASERVRITDTIEKRARILNDLGYGTYDSLHLASAEWTKADVLLTTDDRFQAKAARKLGNPEIPLRNPLSWIKEVQL